jgi:outer membrane protein insertion porin family
MTVILALQPGPVVADDGLKVTQVVITGNQNINKETIENVIKLAAGSQFSDDAVNKDKSAINGLGYFSAVSVRTEDTTEGKRVIYDVSENPLVKDIDIVGSGPISKDDLLTLMRTKPGQVLNVPALNLDVEAIQNRYRDDGYVAYVTEDIGIDRETGVLTIPILIHTIESIDIVGNKKTKKYVFLREMKTKPGMVFNKTTLRDDIARIYNLDILEDIQAPKIEPGSAIGKVAIAIPVTEKQTGNVGLGVGYSSKSKLVGRAEITETNFRGRGEGLTLLWETGTSGGLGGSSSYEIGFHEPWIDKKNTSLSVNVFNKLLYRFSSSVFDNSGSDDSYNERRKGASLGLSRPLTEMTRAFFTIRGETVETSPADISRLSSSDVNRFVAQNGPVQSGTFRLVNNTTDFHKDPAVGWYRAISLEVGNANVTEKFTQPDSNSNLANGLGIGETSVSGPFEKLQLDFRRYFSKGGRKTAPTDKRNTLALRFLGGISSGDLPFFEQYFVGGSDTLRGYREDRFWGNKMLILSAEYRRPVTQGLTGVIFVDVGDAWGAPKTYSVGDNLAQHNGFTPRVGAGVGIRVNTPIGNLRFDYGMGSEGARTHFSIGQAF